MTVHKTMMAETLDEKTGGLEGQEGYGSNFEKGRYKNDDVAESGGEVDDRAGSYEAGYRAPERSDALDAHNPEKRRLGKDEDTNPHINKDEEETNPHINDDDKDEEETNPHINDDKDKEDPNPHIN